jgi:hypothetical protein
MYAKPYPVCVELPPTILGLWSRMQSRQTARPATPS